MRQQPGTGQTSVDSPARRGLLHDAIAAAAAQFRTYMANHFEARRNIFQGLRNVFTQGPQSAPHSQGMPSDRACALRSRAEEMPAELSARAVFEPAEALRRWRPATP